MVAATVGSLTAVVTVGAVDVVLVVSGLVALVDGELSVTVVGEGLDTGSRPAESSLLQASSTADIASATSNLPR